MDELQSIQNPQKHKKSTFMFIFNAKCLEQSTFMFIFAHEIRLWKETY